MIAHFFELLLGHYFGVVGAVFFLLGCWLVISRLRILSCGIRTTGRIEKYTIWRDESDNTKSYFPVIAFEDENEHTHHITATSGVITTAWSGRPKEGIEVEIIYSRSNPEKAIIASFISIWGAPLASIALGVTGMFVAFLIKS